MAELEAIDSFRCQAEHLGGSFMTFGPRKLVQCSNSPTWVAFDIREGQFYGAMALCDDCKKICEVKMPTVKYQRLIYQDKVETRAETVRILEEAYRKHAKSYWNIRTNLNLPKWIREALGIQKVKPVNDKIKE